MSFIMKVCGKQFKCLQGSDADNISVFPYKICEWHNFNLLLIII